MIDIRIMNQRDCEELVRRKVREPLHIISIVDVLDPLPPLNDRRDRVLFLKFNDDEEGENAPQKHHAKAIVDFIRKCPLGSSFVTHCWGGSGRSGAVGLAAQVAVSRISPRVEQARYFGRIYPNLRLAELLDAELKANGRLIEVTTEFREEWARETI